MTSGDVGAVRGRAVAVSAVVAREGHVGVGDTLRVRLADTTAATLRIAAVYERSAGLGDVVFDPAFARRHAPGLTPSAVFISGGPPARGALTRPQYLATLHASNNDDAWGVWLVVGLSVLFAALALINTAAMATSERRADFATIRLLGGTSGHVTRMLALELVPTLLVALLAGTVIAGAAMVGVPDGVRGIPIVVPAVLAGGLCVGAAALALAAGGVAVRIALRVTPAGAPDCCRAGSELEWFADEGLALTDRPTPTTTAARPSRVHASAVTVTFARGAGRGACAACPGGRSRRR